MINAMFDGRDSNSNGVVSYRLQQDSFLFGIDHYSGEIKLKNRPERLVTTRQFMEFKNRPERLVTTRQLMEFKNRPARLVTTGQFM